MPSIILNELLKSTYILNEYYEYPIDCLVWTSRVPLFELIYFLKFRAVVLILCTSTNIPSHKSLEIQLMIRYGCNQNLQHAALDDDTCSMYENIEWQPYGAKQDLKSTHEYNLQHELLLVIHFGNGTNPLNHAHILRLTVDGGNPYCCPCL